MIAFAEAIEPRSVSYGGVYFRSKLEAQFATWLDHLGWKWEYEPFTYYFNEFKYTPDFVVYHPLQDDCDWSDPCFYFKDLSMEFDDEDRPTWPRVVIELKPPTIDLGRIQRVVSGRQRAESGTGDSQFLNVWQLSFHYRNVWIAIGDAFDRSKPSETPTFIRAIDMANYRDIEEESKYDLGVFEYDPIDDSPHLLPDRIRMATRAARYARFQNFRAESNMCKP